MVLERRVLNLDSFQGLHQRRDAGLSFVREIHCTVLNYWSEQLIARNKTEKSSDELPIDQKYRPGDRAGQAHRVQLAARSIISFGYLVVGEISFSFVLYTASSKSSILK